MRTILFKQFANPSGLLGKILGKVMVRSNQELNNWTISLLQIKEDDNILEIGFGPGMALELASKKAPKGLIAGIDCSEVMFKQAKARNMKDVKNGKIDLRLAKVEDFPPFNFKFDKVFAVNSFMFWRDPVLALLNIRKFMNKNGWIGLTVQQEYKRATNETAKELIKKIEMSLVEAGFSEIAIETKRMKPASGICVLAKNV